MAARLAGKTPKKIPIAEETKRATKTESKFIEAVSVLNLAKLPSRQELLAKAVGSIAAPLSGMVNVLQGNLRGLVQVLSQIKK